MGGTSHDRCHASTGPPPTVAARRTSSGSLTDVTPARPRQAGRAPGACHRPPAGSSLREPASIRGFSPEDRAKTDRSRVRAGEPASIRCFSPGRPTVVGHDRAGPGGGPGPARSAITSAGEHPQPNRQRSLSRRSGRRPSRRPGQRPSRRSGRRSGRRPGRRRGGAPVADLQRGVPGAAPVPAVRPEVSCPQHPAAAVASVRTPSSRPRRRGSTRRPPPPSPSRRRPW